MTAMKTLSCLCAVTLSLALTSFADAASSDKAPQGVAASDWSSIRAAHEAWRHGFQKTAVGYEAVNPGQQWCTQFDGRGFTAQPKEGGWQWGLELKSYGFAGEECAMSDTPAAQAEGQRLTYQWDAVVQEWFVNDQRGLEHGFTVQQRPASASTSELAFTLGVRGNLKPVITSDALGVQFQNDAGATVLTYSGLKVWDADGKVLRSRFEPASEGVRLLVDEHEARYPITIDPIAQQAYVKASNPGVHDLFGISVAISGNTMVVGAGGEDSSTTTVNSVPDELATDSGAAYVFVRSGGTWIQQAYLKASNAGANDYFGREVAISGDTIVVSAGSEDGSGAGVNPPVDELAPDAGAAYVFVRSGGGWSQQAYLKAGNPDIGDSFGVGLSVSGDTIVVGAPYEGGSGTGVNPTPNNLASSSGAAYVFTRSAGVWSQQAYLKASNTGSGDGFGYKSSISGDTIIIGAPYEEGSGAGINPPSSNGTPLAGAAYVFVRSGNTWSQQAYLKASNPQYGYVFGISVGISGDTAVVGASWESTSGSGVNPPIDILLPASGAAYVFVRNGSTWSQQAFLKASNPGSYDLFGAEAAISGDTIVVGAIAEDSSSTGINSTPDELADQAGAGYVFVRNGTTWTQQSYVKSSNTQAHDEFAHSVAISGDTIVFGAWYEDSSNSGINGIPNELTADSGAAYVLAGFGPLLPSITIEQPAGYLVADGGSRDFGPVMVGGHLSLTFTIMNSGQGALNLTGTPLVSVVGADAAQFTVTAQPATPVAALTGSTTFTVEYSPTSGGPKVAGLLIASDDTTRSPYNITLTGTTPPPEITVEQGGNSIANGGSKDFGSVASGDNASLTFYIVNEGGSNLLLTNLPKVVINGPDAAMFSVTSPPSSPLIPGGITSFTVRFSPTSLGTKHAQFTIANNDSDEGVYQISLTGTVLPADIALERPPGMNLSDGGIDNLGVVPVGSSTNFTFTVRNVGGQMLGLNGNPRVNLSGADAAMFTLLDSPAATVAPGESSTFTIRFIPTSDGPKTAALSIPSTDGDESPFDITINATVLGFNHDTDGDGLNDASELQMAQFGFDWQVSQTGMVSLYYSSANGAGLYSQSQYDARYIEGQNSVLNNPNAFSLYTSSQYDQNRADGMNLIFNDPNSYGLYTSVQWLAARTLGQLDVMNAPNDYALFTPAQVADSRTAGRNDVTSDPNAYNLFTQSQFQALSVGKPLLQKNPSTGAFTLTLGLEKSTDLTTFTPLPMTAPQTSVNAQGKLEFQFTSPGNAAFFRVQAQ